MDIAIRVVESADQLGCFHEVLIDLRLVAGVLGLKRIELLCQPPLAHIAVTGRSGRGPPQGQADGECRDADHKHGFHIMILMLPDIYRRVPGA